MKLFEVIIFGCVVVSVAARWCCGDVDTTFTSKPSAVARARTIQITQTEYYKLRTGYEPCSNNTIGEKDIPKVLGHGTNETVENKKTAQNWLANIFGLLPNGRLGNKAIHNYCPVFTTKSRPVVAYMLEYYNAAVFTHERCPLKDRVCCRGFKQVRDNCVESSKAKDAAGSLDFLASLGLIG